MSQMSPSDVIHSFKSDLGLNWNKSDHISIEFSICSSVLLSFLRLLPISNDTYKSTKHHSTEHDASRKSFISVIQDAILPHTLFWDEEGVPDVNSIHQWHRKLKTNKIRQTR